MTLFEWVGGGWWVGGIFLRQVKNERLSGWDVHLKITLDGTRSRNPRNTLKSHTHSYQLVHIHAILRLATGKAWHSVLSYFPLLWSSALALLGAHAGGVLVYVLHITSDYKNVAK